MIKFARKSKKMEINFMSDLWYNLENLENEEWKDIEGYEGLYQVSSFGRVKSLARINHKKQNINEKIMKPEVDKRPKRNYLSIRLFNKNGKYFKTGIHRLVALAFIPNPENKPEVNHKDGNKQNNNFDNLEWMTRSENEKHAYDSGLHTKKGEKNSMAKLSEKGVLEIRWKYEKGENIKVLAESYSVSYSGIYNIIKRKIWKHI